MYAWVYAWVWVCTCVWVCVHVCVRGCGCVHLCVRAGGCARTREWVCVEACGRTAAPATLPFQEGGILGPKARAWGYTEHTAPEPAGPDAPGARLRAVCLDDQGNLSLNSSSGKWAHNGP